MTIGTLFSLKQCWTVLTSTSPCTFSQQPTVARNSLTEGSSKSSLLLPASPYWWDEDGNSRWGGLDPLCRQRVYCNSQGIHSATFSGSDHTIVSAASLPPAINVWNFVLYKQAWHRSKRKEKKNGSSDIRRTHSVEWQTERLRMCLTWHHQRWFSRQTDIISNKLVVEPLEALVYMLSHY